MIIILGTKVRVIERSSGEFYCPNCNSRRPYKLKRYAKYFTLFFIPLFQIKNLGEQVKCQKCLMAFKPDVLRQSFKMQPGPEKPAKKSRTNDGGLRAPFQVLVFPYRAVFGLGYEYAVLRRADKGYWHVVAGGGEGDETPLEAARRETHQETGLPKNSSFLRLDMVSSVPVTEFRDSDLWGDDVYVITQYCFGVRAGERQLVLSNEHTEYRWVKYQEAYNLLKYDDNKTALWELDRKLRKLGPRD
jgi:dATP pyrophosphohydrolase